MEPREPYIKIRQELSADKGMILLSGPRQTGKTTLGKIISESFMNSRYFNWDISEHRTSLIENPTFFETIERKDPSMPLIVFDEIHKYRHWKNYLKGVYDQFHDRFKFLVSASGQIDIHQKGGDSLAGRYFLFHLWPFTIAELAGRNRSFDEFRQSPLAAYKANKDELRGIWERLSTLSGFPEPYLAGRTTRYRRWSNTYSRQLIREDIRDLTGIKAIGDLETFHLLLPTKVGAPLSIPSIARDLKVSYNTIRSWLSVFERFYVIFTIRPWTARIARAIHKERKVYLWDAPRVKDPAARLENMVAIELWRAVTTWNDMGYGLFSLHFVKNKEKQEVDFLIAEGGDPFLLIDVNRSEKQPSRDLKKFQLMLGVPAVQLNEESGGYRIVSNGEQSILIAPACQWLSLLP